MGVPGSVVWVSKELVLEELCSVLPWLGWVCGVVVWLSVGYVLCVVVSSVSGVGLVGNSG